MSDTRADVTSMGLFLVSFIMLVFGMIGIFVYSGSDQVPGLVGMSVTISGLLGIVFVLLGIGAWYGGNKFLMVLFGFLAVFLTIYSMADGSGIFADGVQMIFIMMTIFFIIFALWAFVLKAGMMLTILLICAGLVFLFYALTLTSTDAKTLFLLMGIFALIGFAVSVYLALADCMEGKLPTF
jgi:hypothetical protein